MANEFNEAKMMAFGEKLVGELSTMLFGNLVYIGDRLGLFNYLAESGAITVEELASKSSYQPRYLQEWLSGMAAAGWIEYDPETRRFNLPPEHAAFLANENHPMYVGGALQLVGSYGNTVHKIMNCFRNGGGVSLEQQHPDMPEIMDRLSAPLFKNFLTKKWLPELMPQVHQKLTEGGKAADVGCGSGRALVEMALNYPNSRFFGYEPDKASAKLAQKLAAEKGVADRVEIINAPSGEMPGGEFDFITTFDVIHDLAQPQEVINDIHRALKPDGTYLMMEFNCSERLEENISPIGKLMYTSSTMYCLPYSLSQNGAGIGCAMGPELPRKMCFEAGFKRFQKLDFQHPFNVIYEIRN
jgi:SAM-dependent methyltransferase